MGKSYRHSYNSVNRNSFSAIDRRFYRVSGMAASKDSPAQVLGHRLAERMKELGVSQSELAKAVNISQPTVNQLLHKPGRGSKHLHKIARTLKTSPEYLTGETDDPSPRGTVTVATPSARRQSVFMPVQLPSEEILTEMFAGMLLAIEGATREELPQALAELLPTSLASAADGDHSRKRRRSSHSSPSQSRPKRPEL